MEICEGNCESTLSQETSNSFVLEEGLNQTCMYKRGDIGVIEDEKVCRRGQNPAQRHAQRKSATGPQLCLLFRTLCSEYLA